MTFSGPDQNPEQEPNSSPRPGNVPANGGENAGSKTNLPSGGNVNLPGSGMGNLGHAGAPVPDLADDQTISQSTTAVSGVVGGGHGKHHHGHHHGQTVHRPTGMFLNIIVVALIGAMGFIAFKFIEPMFIKAKPTVDADLNAPMPVTGTLVKKLTLDRIDQLPGEIQAYQDVAIFPKIPGFIEWIGIDRGSIVKKDQVLVKMYAPEYLAQKNESEAKVQEANAKLKQGESTLVANKAQLQEAVAQLAADDSTYSRMKAASLTPGVVASNDVVLLAQKVQVDAQRIESWKQKVAASESEVSALGESLAAARRASENFKDFASYLTITAPFDGYITVRNMHKGSFVGPLGNGAYPEIARIAQLSLLRIIVPVPERDCAGILPGAQVQFSVSTFPGKFFTGSVARIGNYLDRSTRTMPVELNYYNPDYTVYPGAFCKVLWPTRRKEPSLFVPSTAVVTTLVESHVCQIVDNHLQWVTVRKGQNMGQYVEVFSNQLKEGDLVSLVASEEMRPDTPVAVTMANEKEAGAPAPDRPHYNESPTN